MIVFQETDDGKFVARLGNVEVLMQEGVELSVTEFDTEQIVPCDDDPSNCPDELEPNNIDACVATCKYAYNCDSAQSYDTMFGNGVDLANTIYQWRLAALGHPSELPSMHKASPMKEVFARKGWIVGEAVFDPLPT